MTDHQIYLSVVIASYNSAEALQKNLSALTNYLSQCSFNSEIIIVDDGSNDNGLTESVVKSNNCIYIKQEVNKGKGAAVKKGMLSAKGKFRIFTDADIPYEPEVIPSFLHYLDFRLLLDALLLVEFLTHNAVSKGLKPKSQKKYLIQQRLMGSHLTLRFFISH